MRRFFFVSCLTFFAVSPASADITVKHQSSIQLSVDGAASQATRLGSSYSVSGSGITLDTVGGLGALSSGTGVGYTPAEYSLTNDGASFNYSEAYFEGDDIQAATTVTNGVVPSLPSLGSTLTQAGGVAGNLDGTITGGGVMTIDAGGAGTSATGQVILSITSH